MDKLFTKVIPDQPKVKIIKEDKPKEELNLGFNADFFLNQDNPVLKLGSIDAIPVEDSTKKKRGRPPKTDGIVPANNHKDQEQSYLDTYNETNMLLKSSIGQIDMLNNEIQQELSVIKASKTLKGKYNYIAELSGTSGTLLGTKISAIRELNSSITNAHKLDLQRIKDLKLNTDDGNDDKKILDMYNAFINTPIGNYGGPTAMIPSVQEAIMATPITTGVDSGIVRVDISGDPGYNSFLNNLSPEQNRMLLENNPNVETVVVYNQETGAKWFDVVDRSSGQSIPNYPRPTDHLLNNMNINIRAGMARNSDVDQNYRLIVTGNNGSIMDY